MVNFISVVIFTLIHSFRILHEIIGYTIAPSGNSSIDYLGFRIGTRFCPITNIINIFYASVPIKPSMSTMVVLVHI